jgi:hypothetical protein
MTEQNESKVFSGLFQGIFPDGTIQYDDQVGLPGDFPLTQAEIDEITRHFESNPIEPPQE